HPEPHRKQFMAQCSACHSPAAWKGKALTFDHNKDSKFQLVGHHANMACRKCHKPSVTGEALGLAVFRGVNTECVGCHRDPHQGQFEGACAKCHSPIGWRKPLAFDHNRDSKYPLLAKHAEVACVKCHIPPSGPRQRLGRAQFRGLKSECADCHKDPHRGQFEAACVKCHPTPAAWTTKALQFDHNRDSKFPLTGKHVSTECIKCHQPQTGGGQLASAIFKGLPSACEACHKVQHPPQYGPLCVSCHNTDHWQKEKTSMDHVLQHRSSGEYLAGKHLTADCNTCHSPSMIASLGQLSRVGYDCGNCHKKDDPHLGTLGANCAKCHGVEGWKKEHLLFNHDKMTSYVLDQHHKNVACAKCHVNNQWKPLTSKCEVCHPKIYDRNKK
ncbi:MAG: DUF3716 domain-containing protein, partial [Verrucomicrobia bacterium]|nr:DUF3716 domain-containing protein [Verrucomicrobiota bacterium]